LRYFGLFFLQLAFLFSLVKLISMVFLVLFSFS